LSGREFLFLDCEHHPSGYHPAGVMLREVGLNIADSGFPTLSAIYFVWISLPATLALLRHNKKISTQPFIWSNILIFDYFFCNYEYQQDILVPQPLRPAQPGFLCLFS